MATHMIDQYTDGVIGGASGAAQTNAAALAAVVGKTAYLTGFDISGGGATAASIVEVSVTGLKGGTQKFGMNVLAGVTGPINTQGGLARTFFDPIPASGPNTAITVSVPTLGAGNTNTYVTVNGKYRD